MTLREQLRKSQLRWGTLSLYERFEQAIISVLGLVIAAIVVIATWQLLLITISLVRSHLLEPIDYAVFQAVFGMIFAVLIALEFKHTLRAVLHGRGTVVQVGSVVLIAILALVRKFIILDVQTASPGLIGALAGAVLALGIVFWLIRRQDRRGTQHLEGSIRRPPGLERETVEVV
ncbi:MAG: phosphate-starvation-inducible PsiE family protein [Candidatus Korobacteraceae bacterium]